MDLVLCHLYLQNKRLDAHNIDWLGTISLAQPLSNVSSDLNLAWIVNGDC